MNGGELYVPSDEELAYLGEAMKRFAPLVQEAFKGMNAEHEAEHSDLLKRLDSIHSVLCQIRERLL